MPNARCDGTGLHRCTRHRHKSGALAQMRRPGTDACSKHALQGATHGSVNKPLLWKAQHSPYSARHQAARAQVSVEMKLCCTDACCAQHALALSGRRSRAPKTHTDERAQVSAAMAFLAQMRVAHIMHMKAKQSPCSAQPQRCIPPSSGTIVSANKTWLMSWRLMSRQQHMINSTCRSLATSPVFLGLGLKASIASTSVGPFHHRANSGSVGFVVRFCPAGPTAGSHCTHDSWKPTDWR